MKSWGSQGPITPFFTSYFRGTERGWQGGQGECFELRDVPDSAPGEVVLFASWPEGGALSVSRHRDGLSEAVVEWFIGQAKAVIGPPDAAPDRRA
jgi:hypothetical protein